MVGIGGMAWATNICKKRDAAGQEIDLAPQDYTSLLISRPKPFQFELQPRHVKREQQVWDNWKERRELARPLFWRCGRQLG